MTDYVFAKGIAALIDALAMLGENQHRLARGDAPAYSDSAIYKVGSDYLEDVGALTAASFRKALPAHDAAPENPTP